MPVDYPGLRVLVGELGVLPTEIRRELRTGFRAAGQRALETARDNASWSSRIPGAITMRVSTSGPSTGVALRVDAARAPHARPYEGLTRGERSTFRHPVFGTSARVAQATRPFLRPAVQSVRDDVVQAARDAVQSAARHAGFR